MALLLVLLQFLMYRSVVSIHTFIPTYRPPLCASCFTPLFSGYLNIFLFFLSIIISHSLIFKIRIHLHKYVRWLGYRISTLYISTHLLGVCPLLSYTTALQSMPPRAPNSDNKQAAPSILKCMKQRTGDVGEKMLLYWGWAGGCSRPPSPRFVESKKFP